jgi:hypothetical protein
MWQSQVESNANKIHKTLGERCNGAERQNVYVFSNINEMVSLLFYCEKKHERSKGSYIDECTRKGRLGIIWLKAGIWKRRSFGRGFHRGKCPPCLEEDDALKLKSREENLCAVNG